MMSASESDSGTLIGFSVYGASAFCREMSSAARTPAAAV